jgi:hypothetical protein
MCRQDPKIPKSKLGNRKLSERTEQRSNISRQPQGQQPIVVVDGEKYDLSNLCIPNTKKQLETRISLYPDPSQWAAIEKGSVERMCKLDQMIRKGEIFRRRVSERSHRPAVLVVDGEQWDLSNLYGSSCESLYPELSQFHDIEYDSAEKMRRLYQTIRKSEIWHGRFRTRRFQQRQQPPVLVVDGKEHDLSNLCIPKKQNIDDPESILLELPKMESLHVQEIPLYDDDEGRFALRDFGDEKVWQAPPVDAKQFPLGTKFVFSFHMQR